MSPTEVELILPVILLSWSLASTKQVLPLAEEKDRVLEVPCDRAIDRQKDRQKNEVCELAHSRLPAW